MPYICCIVNWSLFLWSFIVDSEAADISVNRIPDVNIITSLIKSFLRQLPVPLITYEAYTDFIDVIRKFYSFLHFVFADWDTPQHFFSLWQQFYPFGRVYSSFSIEAFQQLWLWIMALCNKSTQTGPRITVRNVKEALSVTALRFSSW